MTPDKELAAVVAEMRNFCTTDQRTAMWADRLDAIATRLAAAPVAPAAATEKGE